MIDITSGEAGVVQTRQRIHKNYDIDVTIGIETQNIEINIYHEEDLNGNNTELKEVKIDINQFDDIDEDTDVGEELHKHLEDWFDKAFPGLEEETQEDFNAVFAAVWDYIDSRQLY